MQQELIAKMIRWDNLRLKKLGNFNEKDGDGREIVTADEERVLRGAEKLIEIWKEKDLWTVA